MPDGGLLELFPPDIDLGRPGGDREACARPIGRRASPPPRRAVRTARPSPSLALLGELRNALAALALDQQQRFRHLDRATGLQARALGKVPSIDLLAASGENMTFGTLANRSKPAETLACSRYHPLRSHH